MSLSVGAGMAIAGGLAAANTAGNALAQSKLNKKNRKWQEKMYDRRLADQRADWQMNNEYNEQMYNEYNSPTAQARQMQAAGVNPDLNGVDASSLGASSTPAAAPDAGSAPYQMPNIDFLGTFSQVMSMFQQMQSASLDNQMKREQIRSSILPRVLDFASQSYDPKATLESGLSLPVYHKKYLRDYFEGTGMNRSSAKMAARMYDNLLGSDVVKNYFDKKGGLEKSRTDYFSIIGDSLFSGDNEEMEKNFKTFSKAMADFNALVRGAQEAKANYDKDYYDTLDGGDMAGYADSSASYDVAIKGQQYRKGTNYDAYYKHFNEFAKNLEESGPFGAFLSFVARILWDKYRP